MMSARGKPKRLKQAWIKTLHRTRAVQSEFHDTGKEPEQILAAAAHIHGESEKKGQDVVALGTEDEDQSGQSSLQVEGVEDDPVIADVVEETLTAQY